MKIKLLKKIRKNCHIKRINYDSSYSGKKYIVYSQDFGYSIKINNFLDLLKFWKEYIGIDKLTYDNFIYTRKKRRNKKEFNY